MVSHRLLNQLSLATSRINQQYFSVSKSVVPNFGNNFTRAVNYTVFKAVPLSGPSLPVPVELVSGDVFIVAPEYVDAPEC